MDTPATAWIDAVKWNEHGLVAAIARDQQTQVILMQAWMNAEALECTVVKKRATYWSRSRQRLWVKGERSGHEQIVHALWLDCDGDALVIDVTQVGGIACHTGRAHCFFRQLQLNDKGDYVWQNALEVVKTPQSIYGTP